MKRKNDWLKPRGYIHFTSKVSRDDSNYLKGLIQYVKSKDAVSKHPFYPLIHRKIIKRRYKKNPNSNDKGHFYFDDKGNKISNAKQREIFYSTHIDALIYSYYTKVILEPLYEVKLIEEDGLSDCISAYRKIKTKDGKESKNNIHFADDVFKYIRRKGECVALTFDVSKFFDSLDHFILKKSWADLLNKEELPNDHFNIYKSLTNFSYVEFRQVLKEFEIKNPSKLNNSRINCFCSSAEEFRSRVVEKNLIHPHPFENRKTGEKKRNPTRDPNKCLSF